VTRREFRNRLRHFVLWRHGHPSPGISLKSAQVAGNKTDSCGMGIHRVREAMKGKENEAEYFGEVQGEKIAWDGVVPKCHTKA